MTVGELREFLNRYADEREVLAVKDGSWYDLVALRSIEPGGCLIVGVGAYRPQATLFAEKQVAK